MWSIRLPAQVALVADGSPAQQQGILAGDEIISVNNEESRFIQDINKRIKGKINTNFDIQLKRGNDTLAINITTNEKGMLGVQWESMDKFLKVETENYGFLAAIPAGVNKGVDILTTQLKAFKQMFAGTIKAKDSLGGFASITKMFPASWDWTAFWSMTAVLSIILAFMNLLPIPALDGGYVVFLLIEVITGKKVPDKIVEKATMIGFFLLMALMLYANGLDVVRGFSK